MYQRLALIVISSLLAGCSIAPGMQMESPPSQLAYSSNQIRISPNFIPITRNLLLQMNSQDPTVEYHVGIEDILSINVWGHPELLYPSAPMVDQRGINSELNPSVTPTGFLVNHDGTIFFPMINEVNVDGKTTKQIRQQLVQLLSKYIRNPQIDVRVTAYRSNKVYVMGEVNKPGIQPITDIPLTLTDALNLSGGLNQDSADPRHIFVIRGTDMLKPDVYWLDAKSPDALLLAEHFYLKNRDIVFVSTAEVARWNRAISQIMPSIQSVWYTQSTIKQAS